MRTIISKKTNIVEKEEMETAEVLYSYAKEDEKAPEVVAFSLTRKENGNKFATGSYFAKSCTSSVNYLDKQHGDSDMVDAVIAECEAICNEEAPEVEEEETEE